MRLAAAPALAVKLPHAPVVFVAWLKTMGYVRAFLPVSSLCIPHDRALAKQVRKSTPCLLLYTPAMGPTWGTCCRRYCRANTG